MARIACSPRCVPHLCSLMTARRAAGRKGRDQAVADAHQPDPAAHPAATLGVPPCGALLGRRPPALWHHLCGALLRDDLHLADESLLIVFCGELAPPCRETPRLLVRRLSISGLTYRVCLVWLHGFFFYVSTLTPPCLQLCLDVVSASRSPSDGPRRAPAAEAPHRCRPQVFGFLFLVGILTVVITIEVSLVTTYVELCRCAVFCCLHRVPGAAAALLLLLLLL